ncbi:MAG: hypothetical protein JXR95_04980 [Deltaproteobacteria bacterium]|nr:hypothetical protein [Deltaproteobacteria bacterium]
MFSLIKWFLLLVFLIVSFTVPMGNRTLFGHFSAIWKSEEGKDLRDGLCETYDDVKGKAKEKLGNNMQCPGIKPEMRKSDRVSRKKNKKSKVSKKGMRVD